MFPSCRTVCWFGVLFAAAVVAVAREADGQCGQWVSAGASPRNTQDASNPGEGGFLDGAAWRGDLVTVGNFTLVGGTPANRVARWDGRRWHELGSGFNGDSGAISTFNDEVVAGGAFTVAGGVPCPHVARWDGAAWRPMGAGFDDRVLTLFTLDDQLIAVGLFKNSGTTPCGGIARWDGQAWQPYGTGTDGGVWAAALYGGELVIGGEFTSAGGVACNNLARWDGQAWHPLAEGADGGVYALAGFEGHLYAVGQFGHIGAAATTHAGRWDGSRWEAVLGLNKFTDYLYAVRAYHGNLYAGGTVNRGGGCLLRVQDLTIAPAAEQYFVGNPNSETTSVVALTEWRNRLVPLGAWRAVETTCGETFSSGAGCNGAALFDGTAIEAVERGLVSAQLFTPGSGRCLSSVGGTLFVGTSYAIPMTSAGVRCLKSTASAAIGYWDGAGWRGVPKPLLVNPDASQMREYRGNLLVPGASFFGTFNGSEWLPTVLPPSGYPSSMLGWGDLVAVARNSVSSTGVPSVYLGDTQVWVPLGSLNVPVRALGAYQGSLIAAGAFVSVAGQPYNGVAVWNGVSWAPLGPVNSASTGDSITALAEFNGGLYAAGTFTRFGASQVGVARFDGATWALVATCSGAINVMREYAGSLFVGGVFTSLTAQATINACPNRLASWDGAAWHPVADAGTTTDATAISDMAVHQGELFVAGSFTRFNGVPSGGVIRYTINPVVEIEDQPVGAVTCPGGVASLVARTSGTAAAGGYTYRWQRPEPDSPGAWLDLADGPLVVGGKIIATVAGSGSDTLTAAAATDPGPGGVALQARCVISSVCGSTATGAATITVRRTDYNCNGVVDPDDLGDFITEYFTVPPVPGPGGYAIGCPERDPPFDAGYRAAFTDTGSGQCSEPFADNLSDFVTAYFRG